MNDRQEKIEILSFPSFLNFLPELFYVLPRNEFPFWIINLLWPGWTGYKLLPLGGRAVCVWITDCMSESARCLKAVVVYLLYAKIFAV